MIRDIHWYSSKMVLPRAFTILFSSELFFSVVVGSIAGYYGGHWVPTTTTTSAVAVAFLTYASIALGFSLAGLTLALTLPNEGFVQLLSTNRPRGSKYDSYSALLFVFSWTAIIHWLLVVIAVLL